MGAIKREILNCSEFKRICQLNKKRISDKGQYKKLQKIKFLKGVLKVHFSLQQVPTPPKNGMVVVPKESDQQYSIVNLTLKGLDSWVLKVHRWFYWKKPKPLNKKLFWCGLFNLLQHTECNVQWNHVSLYHMYCNTISLNHKQPEIFGKLNF